MEEGKEADLKRLKEITGTVETTLTHLNRLRSIQNVDNYLQKRCEASIELLDQTKDGQATYQKLSNLFIRRNKEDIKEDLQNEIKEFDQHRPKLAELKNNLLDKLSNLKEQYLEAQRSLEKESAKTNA